MEFRSSLYQRAVDQGLNRVLGKVGLTLQKQEGLVRLNYPPSYQAEPRWKSEPNGYQPLLRAIVERRSADYFATVDKLIAVAGDLRDIPVHPRPGASADEPWWSNGWFPVLDAASLYGLLADAKPKRYVEIGSGNSTKFARRAITRRSPKTRLISVDPEPRADIDRLCDESIRKPLEAMPPSFYDQLEPGDIFFFDGSHRSFMNSDVTVFFLDVLPRLPAGVLVHIHDIYLPADYIPEIGSTHLYNEQYLLATFLLGGGAGTEIVLPNWWLTTSPLARAKADELWAALGVSELPLLTKGGGSFWLRVTDKKALPRGNTHCA